MPFLRPNRTRSLACLLSGLLLGIPPVFAANPEITVYNQHFAVIKDYREFPLTAGRNTVRVDDVAALIDPTSVHFKSLTAPDAVTVIEQNFQYDLINKQNILNRMVGKPIRFIKNGVEQHGILLNAPTAIIRAQSPGNPYNNGSQTESTHEFAVRTHDGILLTTLDQIILDELPQGLFPRPTLSWELRSSQGGTHKSELSYITDGITWFADYVVVLNAQDNRLDLNGWVTLDNQSGGSYENARLKLVAGDVRKIQNNPVRNGAFAMPLAMKAEALSPFKEQSFFEYHLYTLQGKTNLPDRETKQISLIQSTGIPVEKKYVFDPAPGFVTYDADSNPVSQKVKTYLNLKNTRENQLGLPLPKGRIRVYKADDSGSLQFVGEDSIDHTPVNESLKLYLGDAFDLVGEKVHLNTRQTDHMTEDEIRVTLRNHKKQAVSIEVDEHPYGNWKIADASHAFKKENAQTVSFPVSVPADGESILHYTLKITQP